MSEWQPIETAPKNPTGEFWGPTILVFCDADELPWPAYWGAGSSGDGCWIIADNSGEPSSEIARENATHWMPITRPPEPRP
jgi:hypothetical protein